MTPKGGRLGRRKSTVISYSICTCCNFYFTSKNLKCHLNDKSKILPRIRSREWYGNVSTKKFEDNSYNKINFIFIDPDSFTICEFLYGELVKVLYNSLFVYCYIFPSRECVYDELYANDYVANCLQNTNRELLFVEKSSCSFYIAKELVISIEKYKSEESATFLDYLKSELDGVILSKDSCIHIPFLINTFEIKVVNITPDEASLNVTQKNSSSLEHHLSGLSISNTLAKSQNSSSFIEDSVLTGNETHFMFKSDKTTILFDAIISKDEASNFDQFTSLPAWFKPECISGIDVYLDRLKDYIVYPLLHSNIFTNIGVNVSNGVLIYGPSGSGKCSIVYKLVHLHSLSIFTLDCSELLSDRSNIKTAAFQYIMKSKPNIVLCKNIEAFDPEDMFLKNSKFSTEELVNLIITMGRKKVFFIGIAKDIDKVNRSFRNSKIFDMELEVLTPSEMERCQILSSILSSLKNNLSTDDVKSIASKTHGYSPADIQSLCHQAGYVCAKRIIYQKVEESSPEYGFISEDFQLPLLRSQPNMLRDTSVDIPNCSWSDIGGMDNVKQQIRECCEWPWKYPEAFKRMSLKPPTGILLYGPPGCSKTMMARALSKESGLNFISVRGPELVNKYVGETERSIRLLFKKARLASPCIIFFDELDSLASTRNSSKNESSSSGNRIIAQLLTEIDGISGNGGSVFVVGATNRPFDLDTALLRQGRFDRLVYVPPPDKVARKEIFRLCLKAMPIDMDVDLEILSKRTNNFSGAEIVGICQEAAISALRDDIKASTITMSNFISVLGKMRPRIQEKSLKAYELFKDINGDMS